MNQFKIVEFSPSTNAEHMGRLVPAFLSIWNEPQNLKYLSLTLRPFDEETIRGWFTHHIENNVRYFCIVDENNQIAGISVNRIDPLNGFDVIGVGVLSSIKRSGVGSLLINNLLNIAKSEGFQSIEINVFADNIVMLRVVLELGFIPVRMEYSKRADGADMVFLRKKIITDPASI